MKTFEWYDITCALTHDIETCEHCKKCGDDGAKIRTEMVEYVKVLDNALDNACQKLNDCFYCNTLWECENTDEKQKYSSCNECIKAHILKESENQDGKD